MELQVESSAKKKTPRNEMAVMGREGDTKTMWDPNNADEVDIARRTFEDFRKKGYAAFYAKGEKGDKAEQMHDFDPKAARIIFVPAMRGG